MTTLDEDNLGRLILRAGGLRIYAAAIRDNTRRCRALKRRCKVLRQIRHLLKPQIKEDQYFPVNLST